MEDNSSYTYTYEKNTDEPKPERSLKYIFAGVIAALAVLSIALGIFFGLNSTEEEETTTVPPTTVESTTEAPVKIPYNPGLYAVNTDGRALFFRKDHSKDADTILEIDDGTELEIIELYYDEAAVSDDYMYWGKTQYKGHTGWVAMKYMKKAYSGNVMTPEDVSGAAAATTTEAAATNAPAEEKTTAKAQESTTAVILQPPTTEAPSTPAEEKTTAKIQETTEAPSKYSAGDYVVSTGGSTLTFRKGPGTKNETILSINDGVKLSVLEVVDTGSSDSITRYWGKVSYQGYTGYVCMTYLDRAN